LNDVTPNDSTFLSSILISSSNQDIDFIGLSSIADPLKSDGHVLRVQAKEDGLGVNAPFLLVDLISAGTTVATLNVPQGTLTTTFTQYELALTPSEADAITDYSLLEIRMVASCDAGTCSAGGSRDSVSVSWVEFAVLDAPVIPPPVLDTVTVVNSTALEINFTAPVDLSNILSYDIRRFNGTAFNTVGNVLNATTLSFVEGDLISDTFFTYHVVSKSASDESVPSNEVSQRTTVILFQASPDSNTGVRWLQGLGSPPCSDLATFECVNENLRFDGDFIQSIGLGDGGTDTDFMTLSDMDDPTRSDSHFLRYAVREAGVGTNPVGFEIELRQGVTVIVNYVHAQGSLTAGNFVQFNRELTSVQADAIDDYSDLEITIRATCSVGCSNQPTAREKVNLSWIIFEIEQVSSPNIEGIDTITPSSLRLTWSSANVDPEITDIVIQRSNGTDFLNIANVTNSTITFDDLNLDENKIFKYRLRGMIQSGGFSTPSQIFTGATPPSTATINSNGTVIEPNANNSFDLETKQIFAFTIEHFNPTQNVVTIIFRDIDTNQLNVFQIIDKMNNGTYGSSQAIKNAGAFYGAKYIEFQNVNDFIGNVTTDTVLALGGSNGTGDNPLFNEATPEQ